MSLPCSLVQFPTTGISAMVGDGGVKSLWDIVWRTWWYWDDDSWFPSVGLTNEIRLESNFELGRD